MARDKFCDVKGCRARDTSLIYYGHPVCDKHWGMDCDRADPFWLKDEFGITHSETTDKVIEIIPKENKNNIDEW